MTWEDAYKVASLVIGSGLLGLVGRILIVIGRWQQWGVTIDKEVTSHGRMLQQQQGILGRILGRLEGKTPDKPADP
jgi:hypothetical protein